jgi:hypothetical protein
VSDSSPNAKFVHFYRDAANYKQYGEVVFRNPDQLPLVSAEAAIRRALIDSDYFVPTEWSIPLASEFPFDPELDHSWYEFVELSSTNAPCTDEDDRTLQQFVASLNSK